MTSTSITTFRGLNHHKIQLLTNHLVDWLIVRLHPIFTMKSHNFSILVPQTTGEKSQEKHPMSFSSAVAAQVADDAAEFEDATHSDFGQILVFWNIPSGRCGSVVPAPAWLRHGLGGDFSWGMGMSYSMKLFDDGISLCESWKHINVFCSQHILCGKILSYVLDTS